MELVDLSVPIESGMPVYPGDPEVSIGPALTVARDGVNVLGLHLGSQAGTHVDAPFHIDDSLPTLDELPLSRFLGPAVVVDARGLAPGSPVGAEYFAAVGAGPLDETPSRGGGAGAGLLDEIPSWRGGAGPLEDAPSGGGGA
ncbi:hypothetical protein HII36_52725, partial [Nonomuraea sp. NN258]|uniref:cyclase family protein n=1 Tax=Nonomuraea antri TaxID=2730852 RepID=UPI001568F075